MQIIIPMSGIGKRFIDEGYKIPKPLIEVDGKPIIEHVINLFPGEKNISFICNDLHLRTTNMRNILENICKIGKIYEISVNHKLGPVFAVSKIFNEINDDDEVIVSYCDYGTWWDYQEFLKDTRERSADGAIACYRGFHPHMLGTDNYAFLKETEKGSRWMEAIQEKQPFTNDRMSEYASNGTYYFRTGAIMKKYFQILMDREMKVKNEYYVSMVYNLLVEDGLKVNIFEIEHMLQWGTPYDLEVYNMWSNYFSNIINEQPIFIDRLDTTTVLPMAGAGSRFSKMGYKDPKPLLDVNGLPMVIQAIKCLPQSTNNIFICQNEHLEKYSLENAIRTTYKDAKIFGIDCITEGQACTTEIGIDKANLDLDKPILITACDNGAYFDMKKYQELVDDETNDVIVWSFRNNPTSRNNPNMYAWMETDEDDNILGVSCKKFIEGKHDIKKSHVIIGTMFFRKARYFIDGLKKNYENNIRSNNEFYVDDVLNQNIKAGLKVKVFEVKNYICWGTPDDYETYLYWQRFFDKCWWHPYEIEKDITYNLKFIPIYEPEVTKYSKSAIEAIKDGWISNLGNNIKKATDKLKNLLDIPYVILMANGTCATHCLFISLKYKYPNIKKIYIPNNCYVAAWNALLMEYPQEIVEVMKINIETWNLETSEEYFKSLDSESAVLVVHNLGNIINVPRLKRIRPDLIFIEDNCEGLFGKYEEIYSGTSSSTLCSAVSFYGNKIITTGEGGAYITHDEELFKLMSKVYSQGMSNVRYVHEILAYNYRMTNVQAGFLIDQLDDLENILKNKRKLFNNYEVLLKDLIDSGKVKLFKKEENTFQADWIFALRIVGNKFSIKETFDYFKKREIDIRPFFYPITAHKHLSNINFDDEISYLLNKEVVMIPSSPGITIEQQKRIIKIIDEFINT